MLIHMAGVCSCVNYFPRYLSLYEKLKFFGDRNKLEDKDDESRRKFIHILKSVPMTYTNHNFYLNGSISGGGSSIINNVPSSPVSVIATTNSIIGNNGEYNLLKSFILCFLNTKIF